MGGKQWWANVLLRLIHINSEVNGSHSRQFVATYVYQAIQARHLAVQLYHEHTNKHTNKREGDSLQSPARESAKFILDGWIIFRAVVLA